MLSFIFKDKSLAIAYFFGKNSAQFLGLTLIFLIKTSSNAGWAQQSSSA